MERIRHRHGLSQHTDEYRAVKLTIKRGWHGTIKKKIRDIAVRRADTLSQYLPDESHGNFTPRPAPRTRTRRPPSSVLTPRSTKTRRTTTDKIKHELDSAHDYYADSSHAHQTQSRDTGTPSRRKRRPTNTTTHPWTGHARPRLYKIRRYHKKNMKATAFAISTQARRSRTTRSDLTSSEAGDRHAAHSGLTAGTIILPDQNLHRPTLKRTGGAGQTPALKKHNRPNQKKAAAEC